MVSVVFIVVVFVLVVCLVVVFVVVLLSNSYLCCCLCCIGMISTMCAKMALKGQKWHDFFKRFMWYFILVTFQFL